jgi:hypothetical protein
MRTFVAGQEAAEASESAELVLGIDVELFTGVPGETALDRRVRLSVAREVLTELSEDAPEDARFIRSLMRRSSGRLSERRAA